MLCWLFFDLKWMIVQVKSESVTYKDGKGTTYTFQQVCLSAKLDLP